MVDGGTSYWIPLTAYSLERIMGAEIIYVDEFGSWFDELPPATAEAIVVKVRMLEAEGVSLRSLTAARSRVRGSLFESSGFSLAATRSGSSTPSTPLEMRCSSSGETRPVTIDSTSGWCGWPTASGSGT